MFSSKGKLTLNDGNNDKQLEDKVVNELMSDYAGKSVELDLIKEVSDSLEKRLEKRREDFIEEKKKLENLHQQIWNSMDAFCDSIWKFSAAHDFSDFINNRLDTPLPEPSKEVEEDPEKIHYLKYQIKLLTEEITSLQENIKVLDLVAKPSEFSPLEDNKSKSPLCESQKNHQETAIEEVQLKISTDTKQSNFLKIKKKVTFIVDKDIPQVPKTSKFESSPELRKKPLKSIFKTPENQKIKVQQRNSTFSLKRKSKICERFEKNWT